ncbi:CoA transferase subunit A [Kineobactrum salinum]|uniref:CoA transferase subunit A n=1 Tax=Kineobactrum salinum TaxID=2708301 RepID=A0A6C0U2C9_9GAMM|nr:CoA transferase subunit A [Kineobactrum salinum]QIB66310.1 CoA transferase subunit A [Kineobactrum salinum]
MDKQYSLREAVAQIEDGMTVGIGGWGARRKPMALLREILRSELKDLTVVACGGAELGMLCATGKVRKLVFAFVPPDSIPLGPCFRQILRSGAIEVMEIDEGMLQLGLRAAAWGLPFMPTGAGLGTDVLTRNPQIKLVDSPYDDKEWVAMPALQLDVSLLHVDRADARGVCQIAGPDHYLDDGFARAATRTIVSCEELVASDFFHDPARARQVFWERSATSVVVEAPGGAHPGSCNPQYGADLRHFGTCVAAAEDGGMVGYLQQYLGADEAEYQHNVGGLDAIRALELPTC